MTKSKPPFALEKKPRPVNGGVYYGQEGFKVLMSDGTEPTFGDYSIALGHIKSHPRPSLRTLLDRSLSEMARKESV